MEEMREAFGKTLVELGKRDKRIVVLDADLKTSTRTVYFAEAFPNRFFQCGVAEQNMMGIAAGMSTLGLIPFPTTFAVFATKRACDQVSISIAYSNANVKIPGTYCGLFTGKAGATHQSVQDLSNMRAMPNMRVAAPGDPQELRAVMIASVQYKGPVYFRVPRVTMSSLFDKGYEFRWGKGICLRGGKDTTIIGTGIMTAKALEAAELMGKDGISVRVIHMPCLKPIDRGIIEKAARETGAILTVENHSIIGGLGSAVAEVLVETVPVFMGRVGVKDAFVETGDDEDLLEKYEMTSKHIAKKAKELLKRHGQD